MPNFILNKKTLKNRHLVAHCVQTDKKKVKNMEIFYYCKLQIACLAFLAFLGYQNIHEGRRLSKVSGKSFCTPIFDSMFVCAYIAIIFDGVTAYTVNHLQTVPLAVNNLCHFLFYFSYQIFIVLHYTYWLCKANKMPQNWYKRICHYLPSLLSMIATAQLMTTTEYRIGKYTNYSMGLSVYLIYGVLLLYFVRTFMIFLQNLRSIRNQKRTSLIAVVSTVMLLLIIQSVFPETLVSSVGVTLVILCIYLGIENPTVKTVEFYHDEMILSFSTLMETKDGSTGSHIRRTSAYAELIAEKLGERIEYRKVIDRDFINEMKSAAPMHDIGKIGIPDSILQKQGKLSDEEYEIMKTHSKIGAEIIQNTFGQMEKLHQQSMAYNVALYHHEKWNGRGYPAGISGIDIPLCARIMAVADVFDAVSAKRCYRDAMPLDTCFKIIENGKGTDFDPEIADVFLQNRAEVEAIYNSVS